MSNNILSNLEPKSVFNYFEQICSIPHGSRNTKQISDFCVSFAKEHNLKYSQTSLTISLSGKTEQTGMKTLHPLSSRGILTWYVRKSMTVI